MGSETDEADHMRSDKYPSVTLPDILRAFACIVTHAFSTRMGGVSEGWYSTMNFSFTRGDNREHVLRITAGWRRARRKAGKNGLNPAETTNIRVVSEDDLEKEL